MYSVDVKTYVPGAMTMVSFDASELNAACSCATVETFTMVPEGGGNEGAGRAGAALLAIANAEKPAQNSTTRRHLRDLNVDTVVIDFPAELEFTATSMPTTRPTAMNGRVRRTMV